MRARNHAINLAVLDGAPPAYLIYGQEDCAEYGLHRREKARLRERITAFEAAHPARVGQVQILTGADELSAMLVMRALDDLTASPLSAAFPKVASFVTANLSDLDRISRYEDLTVRENLESHLAPSPFRARSLRAVRPARVRPPARV